MKFEFSMSTNAEQVKYEYGVFQHHVKTRIRQKLNMNEEVVNTSFPAASWVLFKELKKSVHSIDEWQKTLLDQSRPTKSLWFDADKTNFPWVKGALYAMAEEIGRDMEQDPQVSLGNNLDKSSEQQLLEALDILHVIWPEAAQQIEVLVQEVVWFSAPKFWSGSSPYAFGAIFINPKPHWTVPYFVDTLLHESGHLSLMIKQTRDPLLENPYAKSASPLRKDLRPLIGILHATFVLIRICTGLKKYTSYKDLPNQGDANQLLMNYFSRIENALETLSINAKWTDSGKSLFNDMKNKYDNLSRTI